MEVQFGPNPIDEPNLLYKLQRKIKVFNTSNNLPNRGYNLVASSSKYALVFVGVPDATLSVYQLNQLIDAENEPQHLSVKLQESPTHIAVNCDYELLAVTGGQLLSIYRISDFQHSNVAPSLVIKTEVNPSNFVSALQWNPWKDYADSIAIAFHDGTLFACTAGNGQVKKVPAKARCICWSPKGKQLVTGNSDGTLSQYKPDLTHVKTFPAPNLFENAPVEALAVYWIATYQFAVVYRNASDNSRPAVTIVNTSKTGQTTCLNYEDVCYSMGSNRPWYYYLQALAEWKIILASSSNSMEIATLGSADGANWLQWCQATDETRAELPLTNKTQETYPVGLSIDTCAIHQLPWGENETLPFMPLLHVVSHSGLLTIFNIVNLNREAQAKEIMIVPQQLALPAASLTSIIPDDAPQEPGTTVPAPTADIKPQPIPAQPQAGVFTPSVPTAEIKIPSFTPTQQIAAPTPQVAEPRQVEVTPVPQQPIPQQQVTQTAPQPVQPKPQAAPTKPQKVVDQENAAIKAEQDRINKIKANEDIKNMLIKEVNDFQMELYNFMVKTREAQARIQRDIDAINSNFNFNSLDSEQFKKDCSVEDLRSAVVQLKLELVRACAVVAEARTHSDAKDFHEWTQADPLTTKRVASVKKLAYYVQTQLDQAHKALDYKWNELASKDPQYKSERRMIRPILDDVYQPLVKQQEILSRQQAVLRTLRKTLNECDIGPVFKSISLLRNTPFKKDPLSKLTKNILNMSIEPKSPRPNQSLLTPQKLDALRDALSNHKTTKIKPVNVELRQHLANLKMNYEKSMRDKAAQQIQVKTEPEIVAESKVPIKFEPKIEPQATIKIEAKTEPPKVKPVPAFTSVPNAKAQPINVARTLFTDEPKPEPVTQPAKPQPVIQPSFSKPQAQPSVFSPQLPQSPTHTKSVLKDLLQNKSQANLEAKNDANTFMGQKIGSPTAFGQQSSSQPSTNTFTAKPIADISNMFNKFAPQSFAAEPKPNISNVQSSETGEIEATDTPKTFDLKSKEKPMTNLFGMKNTTLPVSSPIVPDVLKTTIPDKKPEMKVTVKPLDKLKENVPEKTSEASKTAVKVAEKKDAVKPFGATNKSFFFGSTNADPSNDKPLDLKSEAKVTTSKPTSKVSEATTADTSTLGTTTESKAVEASKVSIKSETSTSSDTSSVSIASKPQQTTPLSESTDTLTSTDTAKAVSSSAASIFSSAVAAQPKTTGSIFSSSTSVFGTTTATSIFGSSTKSSAFSGSLFSTSTAASAFGQTSAQTSKASTASSIFASAVAVQASGTSTSSAATTESTTAESSVNSIATSANASPTPIVSNAITSSVPNVGTATGFITTNTTSTVSTTVTIPATTPAAHPAPVFGTTTSPSAFAPTTSSSIFGTGVFPATTQTPTFGQTAQPVTQASTFGQTAQPAPQASTFGQTAQPVTQASAFGQTSHPVTQASTFGQTSQPITQASTFGQTTQPVTQASAFGQASPPATQASSFGQTASVFGSPTTQTSIFGTTPAPIFGTAATQATVFGTSTATTQASVFGTSQGTQASVFGTPTTQTSVFGTPTQTTQTSVFGTPTQTTQVSVFGTPTQTTQASIFGTPTQAAQASTVFGTPTTTQSGSLFGGAEANLFAAASISTTNAATPSSGGSIFGGGSSSPGSVFGASGGNVFGGKSTFGQSNSSAASIFGGAAGASTFGQSSDQQKSWNFWAGANNNSGGFGSTGFGQTATTQSSSIFGGSTGGSFSAPSAGAFGTQQPNAFGSQSPKPSVFGSPQQQTSPAFGGSPSFGAKPVFGQTPGFGSPTSGGFGSFGGFNKSPTSAGFGGPASFGTSAFSGSAFTNTSPGFGSPTQSNATFESLATQNTMTFGNLAQQAQQPQQQTPSFNASPSFTEWRG